MMATNRGEPETGEAMDRSSSGRPVELHAAGAPMAFASIDAPHASAALRAPAEFAAASDAVRIVSGSAGLVAIEAQWRAVSAASCDAAVFLGFGYALAAARYHEARGEGVLTALVGHAARPAAIVSVVLRRRAGIVTAAALGDPVTQYSDALLIREAPPRLVGAALRAIAREGRVDLFAFRRVRAQSPLAGALAMFGRTHVARSEAPYADLAACDDVPSLLLAIAGAKPRRERARSRRRLAERGTLGFETFRGEAALGPLREAFAVKSRWLAKAGLMSRVVGDPAALALLEGAARDPEDGAALVVARLSVDGAPAAYEVGLARGRRFHAYLGAVADAFAFASPGKIVMEETLAWAKAERFAVYDLLSPADRYKREWSNGATAVCDHAAPVTLKGRLYAGPWARLRPALRRGLDLLPASLRRAVFSAVRASRAEAR